MTIGGQSATIAYAGGVSWLGPGLTQINLIVPAGITGSGAVPVVIQSAGISSPGGVTLAIAP